MNDDLAHGIVVDRHLLEALPLGFCLFDDSQNLVLMNEAFWRRLDLPSDLLGAGMSLSDAMRVLAHQGVFGPGDPELQAQDAARVEAGRPRRLRRALADGRAYEFALVMMPDGFCLATATEISTLLRQRDAADRRQARLSSTLEALRTGIAVFDAEGTLLLSNRHFGELLNLPADAVRTGLAFTELDNLLRADADVEGFDAISSPAQALASQLAPQPGPVVPQRCLHADGRLIEIAATRLPDGGSTVTVTDISPAAAADDTLRRRARLLALMFERLPHGMAVFAADRRLSMFNRAFAQILADADPKIGDRWEALVDRLDAVGDYGRPAVSGERSAMAGQLAGLDLRQAQSWRRRRHNGVAIDVRLNPLPDGGATCVITDITAAPGRDGVASGSGPETTLAPQDMAAMLGSVRYGIILWDNDRHLVACNPVVAAQLGLPASLLTPGRSQHEVLSAMAEKGEFGSWEEAAGRARALLARPIDQPFVERLSGSGGQQMEITSDPVAHDGFIWTCADISERHEAEAELRRARTAAEAASLAKSSFLATMSHELRTPLNAVIGFSETLLREVGLRESGDGRDPNHVAEFATAINDAGKHLLTLINNILDVARIEAGRFDLATDRIELSSLVAACIRHASSAARAAEVTLHGDIPKDLPLLRGDERRLRQVLNHLLANGIKFTDSGGFVRVDASLRAAGQAGEAGGDLLISVADTGIGIPEADLERVFQPFTQIDDGLARRASGSGLGLYFCRALVSAHGGELTLASRPGKGTTAVVRFPRSRLIEGGQAS